MRSFGGPDSLSTGGSLDDEHHIWRDATAIVTLYDAFMSDDSSWNPRSGKVLALDWLRQPSG